MAEDSVLQNEDIMVRNDLLRINGKTYMHSDYYRYGDAGIQKNTYFPAEEEDFGLKEGDSGKAGQGELIPSNTANGKYDTKLVGLYKQLLTTHPQTYKFEKKGEKAIKEEYKSNEPIVVHTPTVASVVIEDPETGEIINGDNGYKNDQLFWQAVNPYVDYQLLLDGTYTIQFNPVTHLEHMGYDIPELVDSLYNKYCKFREVRFPFAVQINGKIYEPDGTGWTEWIDLSLDQSTTIGGFEGGDISDLFEVDFYIPPWAEENITDDPNKQTYPDPYIIQYRVAPENIIDHNGVNHIDDTEYLLNQTLDGNPLYDYVSTYTVNVQVSGVIYGFQAVGINDKDGFFGPPDYADKKTWGVGSSQLFSFCPSKQEKRSGTLNRIGGTSVRYTVDGSLTNEWNERNTLPFSAGRSWAYGGEGFLKKGHTFTFTLRTISNLWNEDGDETGEDLIVIKPHFRYISPDGEVDDNVQIYCHEQNVEGTETNKYVRFGSELDRSIVNETTISDVRNDGAYYSDVNLGRPIFKYRIQPFPNSYQQDDAEISMRLTNAFMYNKHKLTNPEYPKESYENTNIYLRRTTPSYCLSDIKLNSRLRLLTGNVEQLEMNLENEGSSLQYIQDKTDDGVTYDITEATNPTLWNKMRLSMQTWFGEYWIPNQLYVTRETIKADTDGDGVEEEYETVWDYAVANGYVDGTEDFFIKEGYLVVNFQIYTVNDGVLHLTYTGGNKDQWSLEGPPEEIYTNDRPGKDPVKIDVEPGDVGVIYMDRKVDEFFYVGFNRIN